MFMTLAQFKLKYPNARSAVCMTALSLHGDTDTAFFEGNYDKAMMGSFLTSYVYVNGWTVMVKDIQII